MADREKPNKKWWKYLLKNNEKEQDETKTEEEKKKEEENLKKVAPKFQGGFKGLTVLLCCIFCFSFCYARYKKFSFYELFPIYVVAYNSLISIQYFDDRTKHWLKNPTDSQNGLWLRVVAIANLTVVLYFIFVETARRLLHDGSSPGQSLLARVWNILHGVSADVATKVNSVMCCLELHTNPLTTTGCFCNPCASIITHIFMYLQVVFVTGATFGLMHLAYVFITVAKDTIRHRKLALLFVGSLIGYIWSNDSEGRMHMGARVLHIFFAFNIVFAIPRNIREPTVWRASIFVIGGLLFAVSWVWDLMSGAEPDWIKRGFHLYFWLNLVLYVPDVCVENKKKDVENKKKDDCDPSEANNKCAKCLEWFTIVVPKCAFMERFKIVVGDCALTARQMLFEAYVEIPLLFIYGNEDSVQHPWSVICSRPVRKYLCPKRPADNAETNETAAKAEADKNGGQKQADKNRWTKFLKSALFVFVHVLILFDPSDKDDQSGPLEQSLKHLTSGETWTLLAVSFAFVTLLRERYIARFCGGFNPLSRYLGSVMKSNAVPLSMSGIFFIFFLSVFMLGTSAIFNSFASIVVKDRDDHWFDGSMKRMTFYAVNTICIFSMYAIWDLVQDSLTSHLEEQRHNLYMTVAGASGIEWEEKCCKGDDKKKSSKGDDNPENASTNKIQEYILKHRSNLQLVTFFSFLVGGVATVFLNPSEGPPKAEYFNDTNSISMFNMSLARDDPDYDKYRKSFNHTYSGCTARWGGDLTALDHAILARMAYFQPFHRCAVPPCTCDEANKNEKDDMKHALAFLFPEQYYGKVSLTEDWETHPQRKEDIDKGRFYKYYRFDFPKQKHTVVAVQGTDPGDLRDVIVDLRLWIVSGLVDMSERLVSLVNLLPSRQRAKLQSYISLIQTAIIMDEPNVRASVCMYIPMAGCGR